MVHKNLNLGEFSYHVRYILELFIILMFISMHMHIIHDAGLCLDAFVSSGVFDIIYWFM